jgi:hypothetical protein
MVSKRGFLGFLSGLIAATFAPKTTLSDPKPKGKVYALAGERVTCENGHHICTFAQTVYIGDMQYPDTQFTDWQQSYPRLTSCVRQMQRQVLYTWRNTPHWNPMARSLEFNEHLR